MVEVDVTMFLHILTMVIMMYVLNRVLYKPVLGILEERAQKIDAMNDEVADFEKNAQKRQEALNLKMREASGKAKAALEGARSQAQAAGAEKINAIRKQAEESKSHQLAEIRAEIVTARKELENNATDFAQAMAGKILGRSLDA